MFNLQGSEIIVILLLALVVLGPEKLPDAIRKFSQTYGELRKMGSGFQSELKSALDEPMREMRETAEMVRNAADPAKISEEAENEARLRSQADAAMLAATPDLPVSAEAAAVNDPTAARDARPAPVPDSKPVKPVNQIAASMARGPIEPPSGPEPLTEPPVGGPVDLPPPSGAVPTEASTP